MGSRELQMCRTVSKPVSVVNGWYRLVLFYEGQEVEPRVRQLKKNRLCGILLSEQKIDG